MLRYVFNNTSHNDEDSICVREVWKWSGSYSGRGWTFVLGPLTLAQRKHSVTSSNKPASGTLGWAHPSLQNIQVRQPGLITENGIHLSAHSWESQLYGALVCWSQKHDQMTHSSTLGLSGPFSLLGRELATKMVGSQSLEWWPEEVYSRSKQLLFGGLQELG